MATSQKNARRKKGRPKGTITSMPVDLPFVNWRLDCSGFVARPNRLDDQMARVCARCGTTAPHGNPAEFRLWVLASEVRSCFADVLADCGGTLTDLVAPWQPASTIEGEPPFATASDYDRMAEGGDGFGPDDDLTLRGDRWAANPVRRAERPVAKGPLRGLRGGQRRRGDDRTKWLRDARDLGRRLAFTTGHDILRLACERMPFAPATAPLLALRRVALDVEARDLRVRLRFHASDDSDQFEFERERV